MKKRLTTFLMALSLSGCATTGVTMHESEAKFRLFVDVTPKEAVIFVDDVALSNGQNTAEIPLQITAGTRRIAIACDGYYPFKTTLEYIQPGEVYTLKTTLITSEF